MENRGGIIMTSQAVFFLVLGAIILYGGLLMTVIIYFKGLKDED